VAIIYTTGTINQPNVGSVGLAMAEKIRDDIVAHAAWDLIEEFTAPAGTVRWYVFKCLATESGLPNDFYAILQRTLSSGILRMFICEGYNSATHAVSFFAPWASSASEPFDSEGRSTKTYVLGTTDITTSTTNPKHSAWVPNSVSTKWWIIVADDGLTIAFNGTANGFWNFGAYIPLSSIPNSMPLQMTDGADPVGAVTRNPAVAGVSVSSYALVVYGGGGSSVNGTYLGFVGRLDTNDKMQENQRVVAELGVQTSDANGFTNRAIFGWMLGKQKRLRVGLNPPAAFAFGDAYVLQGRLWVPCFPTDGRMWDTGVSA